MRLALFDLAVPRSPSRFPRHPSPALLAAAAAIADGDEVVYLGNVSASRAAALEADRVLLAVPPWRKELAAPFHELLGERLQVVDPWAPEATESSSVAVGYDLVRSDCHADVDLAPAGAPVHPWAVTSKSVSTSRERLGAASAALSGLRQTHLVLADMSESLDAERLASLADLVLVGLRERKSLIQLHLRAWPADLLAPYIERHLPTLPIGSLDLLVGSLRAESLSAIGSPFSSDEAIAAIEAVARMGLAHATQLSLVLGLPGETIDDAVTVLNQSLQLCREHGLAGVRCALWLGEPTPPTDASDQRTRFLDVHPDWDAAEYQGLHDLAAVLRAALEHISLLGPGFLAEWDEAG